MPAIRSQSGSPTQFSFEGNWVGPAPGQTLHTLRRQDLPAGVNTIAEAEDYINRVWLPRECRDEAGLVTCFAMLRVVAFTSPTNWNVELRVSDSPIEKWWA
jgi:hypothetical protein